MQAFDMVQACTAVVSAVAAVVSAAAAVLTVRVQRHDVQRRQPGSDDGSCRDSSWEYLKSRIRRSESSNSFALLPS